jgi:long-chain acyl-CoA synthetase
MEFPGYGNDSGGVVHVPLYPNIGPREYQFIVDHSEARMIIVSGLEYYNKLKESADSSKNIEKIYSFDYLDECLNWSEIIEKGKEANEELKDLLKKRRDEINETT